MYRLIGYFLFFFALTGLAACDNGNDSTVSAHSQGRSQQNKFTLLDGRLTLTLPGMMRDNSKSLTPPSNSKFLFSDPSGAQSVIVLVDPAVDIPPDQQAKGLLQLYQKKTPDLQVMADKPLTIDNLTLHRLDLLEESQGGKAKTLTVFIVGNLYQRVVTIQISLVANDITQAQKQAEEIVQSLQLKSGS